MQAASTLHNFNFLLGKEFYRRKNKILDLTRLFIVFIKHLEKFQIAKMCLKITIPTLISKNSAENSNTVLRHIRSPLKVLPYKNVY